MCFFQSGIDVDIKTKYVRHLCETRQAKEQGCTNIFKFIHSKRMFAHFIFVWIAIVRRIFDEGTYDRRIK